MPFPRPTSPLDFEPLQPRPEEILLDESSSEDDEGKRASKKRRVEKLGQNYLQGKRLFILSAGLNGPLGDGWKNPWKKKSARRIEVDDHGRARVKNGPRASAFVPETIQRPAIHDAVELVDPPPTAVRRANTDGFQTLAKAADVPNLEHKTHPQESLLQREVVENSRHYVQTKHASPLRPANNPFQSRLAAEGILRAEDWLRTNKKLSMPSEHPGSSPTPLPRPQPSEPVGLPQDAKSDTVKSAAVEEARPEQVLSHPGFTPINIRSQRGTLSAGFTGAQKAEERIPTASPTRGDFFQLATKALESLSRSRAKDQNMTEVSAASPKINLGRSILTKKSGNLPNVSPTRPNTSEGLPVPMIQKNKTGMPRRSLHTIPPSTHLPAFEYRPRAPPPAQGKSLDAAAEASPSTRRFQGKEGGVIPRRMEFTSSTESPKKAVTNNELDVLNGNHAAEEDHENVPVRTEPQVSEPEIPQIPQRPVLSTETSKADTASISNIPSAQVVPQEQVGPAPLESGQSAILIETGDKISDIPRQADEERVEDSIIFLSTQEAVAKAQANFQADLITPHKARSPAKGPEKHTKRSMKRKDGITPFVAFNTPSPERKRELAPGDTTLPPMSTQAMIDAMTPFAFSTVKKAAAGAPYGPPSSTTRPKSTVTKKRKRASFAPSSPQPAQASIKASLKITKPNSRSSSNEPHKDVEIDDPSPFGKQGLDMETSPEASPKNSPRRAASPDPVADSLTNFSSLLKTGQGPTTIPPHSARSATVPFVPSGESAPMSRSTPLPSAQQQQDGQQMQPLGGFGDSSDYDNLEDMMDEVGSYLHSWDPEKEMRAAGANGGGSGQAMGGSSVLSASTRGSVLKSGRGSLKVNGRFR